MSLLQLPLDIKESRINEKHVSQYQKHNYFQVHQKPGQHQQKVIKTLDGEKNRKLSP